MRHRLFRRLAILVASFAVAAPLAAHAAGSQGGAGATILNGLSVIKEADLDFGQVIPGASAANVTVSTSGQRQCGQAVTCMGAATAARFSIHGRARERVNLFLDRSSVTLSNGSGRSMTATLSLSANSLWLASGSGSVLVGGRLRVGRQQPTGTYRGTFSLIAYYD